MWNQNGSNVYDLHIYFMVTNYIFIVSATRFQIILTCFDKGFLYCIYFGTKLLKLCISCHMSLPLLFNWKMLLTIFENHFDYQRSAGGC